MNRKTIVKIGLGLLTLAAAVCLGVVWSPDQIKDRLVDTATIIMLIGGLTLFVGCYA